MGRLRLLIAGITITFYRPRRRVWTRLAPDGRLGIVWRSDRYVDVEREFGRLLDQLVAARRAWRSTGGATSPGRTTLMSARDSETNEPGNHRRC